MKRMLCLLLALGLLLLIGCSKETASSSLSKKYPFEIKKASALLPLQEFKMKTFYSETTDVVKQVEGVSIDTSDWWGAYSGSNTEHSFLMDSYNRLLAFFLGNRSDGFSEAEYHFHTYRERIRQEQKIVIPCLDDSPFPFNEGALYYGNWYQKTSLPEIAFGDGEGLSVTLWELTELQQQEYATVDGWDLVQMLKINSGTPWQKMTMEEATDSLELIEQIYEAPVVMQDVKTIAVVRDRTDGVRTVEFRYKDWYINVYGPAETVNQELIMRFSLAYYAQKPQQPISISSTVSSAS